MRVKRLEIQGFKSFKDKTIVHFDHSITGIVGPNGCGKSNIVDAVFWVMGEQSYKHMRGSGSDDLIFNGSSKYPSLGLAEVTMVLETQEVDTANAPAGASAGDLPLPTKKKEVSVTRRVYRGGEGEYFINGVQARLKDIKELFMDTGVGAKGYSVIEQGQIGRIVQAKPEERRQLIEEAAGIAKYRARKNESIRKMESAKSNLSRLNDIVQEIERSLKSLERQAQKAKKYQEYKTELLEKEVTWGRRKNRVLRAQFGDLTKQREAAEQQTIALRVEIQTLENNIEADRLAQTEDGKKVESMQEMVQRLDRDIAEAQSALELSKNRQEDLEQQLQHSRAEKIQLEEALETESSQIQTKRDEAAGLEAEIANFDQVVEALEKELSERRSRSSEARDAIQTGQSELIQLKSQSADLKSQSAGLVERIESAGRQSEKIVGRRAEINQKLSEHRSRVEQVEQKLGEFQSQVQLLQDQRTQALSEIDQWTATIEEQGQERDRANSELTQAQSRLHSLQELAKAYEGLSEGSRAVMKWAEDKNPNGFRPLADLINVRSGYEEVVETWLGSRLDYLVSEESKWSMMAIDHLKESDDGRVSIVHPEKNPLAPAYSSEINSTVYANLVRQQFSKLGFEDVERLADVVEIRADAERFLSDYRDTWVVDRIDRLEGHFSEISKFGRHLVIVDRQGCIWDSSGVLRGGSLETTESASLIRRRQALIELEQQVERFTEVFDEINQRLKRSQASLSTSRDQLSRTEHELKQSEVMVAELTRDEQLIRQSIEESNNHLQAIEVEQTEIDRMISDAREQYAAFEKEIEKVDFRQNEITQDLESRGQSLGEFDEAVREQEEKLQEQKIQKASSHERFQSIEREVQAAESFIVQRRERLTQIDQSIERAEQRLTEEKLRQTDGEGGLQGKIESLKEEYAEAYKNLTVLKEQVESFANRLSEGMERIREIHTEIDRSTKKSNEVAIEMERLSAELDHLEQNLEEKYGKGCLEQVSIAPEQEEMDEPIVTAEMSEAEEAELAEEVERLRERIRRLGEVNTMAIEEYEELRTRYDHLCQERLDLEESITNLQAAIEHINETSKVRFKKAFDSISSRFNKLFPIIFGGGRAELSLVVPEDGDVLDSGIEILAQPPGTKIANMNLLSGGQKALTAVAFIFSIFMVKPSPFCVLDEVDAPLDDANVGKFNALLREMSNNTQFILITHNKKTMELNDSLYGVTMEEPGVSKMISVELH